MKKFINFTLIAIASLAVACHKDTALTHLQPIAFTGPATASANTVILTAANDSSAVLTLSWTAVVYPVKAHVTYTIWADLPADTLGATPWANAQQVIVGNDILSKTFKGADLNTLAIKTGIVANDTAKMIFRIEANQDRATYTKAVTVTVSPWASLAPPSNGFPVLYIPGDYQGWNAATAGTVAAPTAGFYPLATSANIYEGYIYEPAGGTDQFKFTSAPDFNHIIYGDSGTPGLLTNSSTGITGGMTLPGPGEYELSANPVTLAWSYTLTTWSIIGDATPNGWNTDTQMAYNPTTQSWSITLNLITTGSFKFRANNAWVIDFGLDPATNKIEYADNPIFGSKTGLNNMTVPANGNYTITLYLGNPNNYYYTAIKN